MVSRDSNQLATILARLPNHYRIGGVLAILGALCITIGVLAARGSLIGLLVVLGAPLLVVGVLGANRYFSTLILILPLTALAMRPAYIPVGHASQLPISMLLGMGLVGLWILTMLARRSWQLVPTPMNLPLLAFMAVCIISMPWGIIWADPILNLAIMGNFRVIQAASLISFLVSMWVPFLIGRFIDRPWKIWFYLWSFIICGLLMTASQFFRISQIFLVDGGLWSLWFVMPLASLVITYPSLGWHWRILGAAIIGWHLFLVVIRNSLWISGWLPTLIGLLAIVFLHSRKAFALALVLTVLVTAVGPGRNYLERVTADNIAEGGLGRLEIWARNLSIVSQHWLLGTGPAGYAPYNMTYFRDDARSTHNNYFDILAQFGVVGLGLWLWFMGVSLWFAWRIVRRAPAGLLRTTAIAATAGWAAALASMMLGDWLLPFAYNQTVGGFRYTVYSWIFLGLLISVHQLVGQTSAAPSTAMAHP